MMNESQHLTVRSIPDGPDAADYPFLKRLRDPRVLVMRVRPEVVSRQDALAAKISNTSTLNALGPAVWSFATAGAILSNSVQGESKKEHISMKKSQNCLTTNDTPLSSFRSRGGHSVNHEVWYDWTIFLMATSIACGLMNPRAISKSSGPQAG